MNRPYVETDAERIQREQRMRRLEAAADADARGVALEKQVAQTPLQRSGPTIAELQAEVWKYTVEKGWADDEKMGRTIGDLFMLMVCEVAEAYEQHRDWHDPDAIYVTAGKPEGIPIELADVVIRILSFCGKHGIDLQDAVLKKMAYNETREFRHGGKRA